jgi:hypothetical protein
MNALFNINILLLLSNSNFNIKSFIILKDTKCCKQLNDFTFEETNDLVYQNNIFDAELIFRDNIPYLTLGYDDILDYNVFVPVIKDNKNNVNILEYSYYKSCQK